MRSMRPPAKFARTCARVPCPSRRAVCAHCEAKPADATPPTLTPEQKAEMEEAMKNPEVQKRMAAMQEAMKRPEMQQQMQEMQSAMANPALQERLKSLQDDPEFKDMFEDIRNNGPAALMKYMNNTALVAKLGAKMGDIPQQAAAASAPAEPEINDLLDASKAGDLEAVEDFLAVGKDKNMQDAEGRTPLHYAAAQNFTRIVSALTEAGADTELRDSKANTPLHYAAGYGRLDSLCILLEAGADVTAENATGKRAVDLAKLNDENPVLKDTEVMEMLSK